MQIVAIDKIIVNREERQRRELTGLPELADSIRRQSAALPDTGGLIHPIVVTRDLVLIAGERRFTACRDHLGYTHIAVNYADELSSSAMRSIELEENIKRVDISWQDQVRAIQEYHELRRSEDPSWQQKDTAEALGISPQETGNKIQVARELRSNPKIAEAPKYSVALGITKRAEARRDDQVISQVAASVGASEAAPKPEVPADGIINASFIDWAPTYSGSRFNFIHCDFPYGINAGDFNQGGAAAHGGYDDSEENYWNLCSALCNNLDRLATDSCHLMFWFSMKFYQQTLDFFADNSDFVIDPFPLIWMKSDNVGILPDPTRGPRRIYETALFGRRGDRPVVQAVANAYAAPTVRDRHMSEKPEPMLRHFFRMLVDSNSIVLDPTAGSGSAIRAAEAAGAKHALGLEINPEFAGIANAELNRARKARSK